MGTERTRQQEFYPRGLSLARRQARKPEKRPAETPAEAELNVDERTCWDRRADRRKAGRAQADHRGRGILDRRLDLGRAARSARRLRLLSRRRSGLYPRCAAAADGYSRRRDEGNPLGLG